MSDNDNPADAEWDGPQSLAEEAFRAVNERSKRGEQRRQPSDVQPTA